MTVKLIELGNALSLVAFAGTALGCSAGNAGQPDGSAMGRPGSSRPDASSDHAPGSHHEAGPDIRPDASSGTDAGSGDEAGRDSGGGSDSGSDPPGPHTVTPCPTGASEIGSWVEITPTGVDLFNGDLGVNAFVVDPSNTSTLYVGTYEQGIHKSTDCGATWKHINTGMNGPEIGTGRQWTMAIDPVEPNIIYANAGYGPFGLFKSVNGGVDWIQLFPEDSEFSRYADAFVEAVAVDPTNHRHLLVHSHGTCGGPVAGETCYAESLDAGATWRLVKAFPGLGYEAVGTLILSGGTWLTFEPFEGIFLTQNSGATWTHAYQGPAANHTGTLYKHGDGYYYAASFDGVLKSPDGVAWTLIADSPRSFSLTGDGTTIWTSMYDDDPEVAYYTSTGSLTSWTAYPSPKLRRGSWYMRYDRDHNLLYTSNENGGLWRVKTK